MPFTLFSDKFRQKPGPPRKSLSLSNLNLGAAEMQKELGINYGPVKLNLGGSELAFEAGEWISDSGNVGNNRAAKQLREQNKNLQEENNLLKVKVELLLDMLSVRTAELHVLNNHVEQIAKQRR